MLIEILALNNCVLSDKLNVAFMMPLIHGDVLFIDPFISGGVVSSEIFHNEVALTNEMPSLTVIFKQYAPSVVIFVVKL